MIWTLTKLEKFLTDNNVDISKYGKGESKTLNHLLREIIKGECQISVKDGKVLRIVHALSINVLYKGEVLKEEYQLFKDGRKRRRIMDCSVAEKLHPHELKNLKEAVKRGIAEELKIKDITDDQIVELPKITRSRKSGSYPGTIMDMVLYKYDINLKYHQYHPYGYIEHQEDKDTYFIWVKKKELKRSGWITESKDDNNLANCIKIIDELETIAPILTDVGIKISGEIFYQWDSGFYVMIDLYKFHQIYKWCRSTEIYKLEEYEEFSNRLNDIVKDTNNYIIDLDQKYKNGPIFLIMMEKDFDIILNTDRQKLGRWTAYRKKIFNPS